MRIEEGVLIRGVLNGTAWLTDDLTHMVLVVSTCICVYCECACMYSHNDDVTVLYPCDGLPVI